MPTSNPDGTTDSNNEAAQFGVRHDQAKQDIDLRGRILLVEDGADCQQLVSMQLNSAEVLIASAEDGQVAVQMATAQPFDLILMDIRMPVMDGYAATAELRRRGLTTPIVALTALATVEDRNRCIDSGCNDYLPKPVERHKLLAVVSQYLGKRETTNAVSATPR
jgi:CheY-like chemotaxis protein